MYLIQKVVKLRDVVAFAYGDSMQQDVQNKQEIFFCMMWIRYIYPTKRRVLTVRCLRI